MQSMLAASPFLLAALVANAVKLNSGGKKGKAGHLYGGYVRRPHRVKDI